MPLSDSTTLALPEDPFVLLLRQYAAAVGLDYMPNERLALSRGTKEHLLECQKQFRCIGDPPSIRMMLSEPPGVLL